MALRRILKVKEERVPLKGRVVQGAHALSLPRLVVWLHQRLGGAPYIQRTVSPDAPHLSSGTAADGAETQRKTGKNPKRARPAEHAASQGGKSAKNVNLTGHGPGQGFLSKTKCPVVRNSVTPIPG